MRRSLLAALLATTLAAAACGSDTPTTPTTPTPTQVTDTFGGTLNPNGAAIHQFSVQAAGTVTASIASLSNEAAVVGLSLGIWNGTACAIVLDNTAATVGTNMFGSATNVGNLCVRVYDSGQVTSAVDYQLSVTHY
jgi:ABC-type nitrate/sulfonate/bicarbonate transport system permease component